MTEAAAGPAEVARGFLCAGTVMMFCAEAETWPVFSASLRGLCRGLPASAGSVTYRREYQVLAAQVLADSQAALSPGRLQMMAMRLFAQCVGVAAGEASDLGLLLSGVLPETWKAVAAVTGRFVSEPERWPVFLAWAWQPENPRSAAEFLAVEGPEGLDRVCAAAVTHA